MWLKKNIKIIEDSTNNIIIRFFFIKFKLNKNNFLCKIAKKFNLDKHLKKLIVNKKNNLSISEWINKYEDALKNTLDVRDNIEVVHGFENTIWTCWLQGFQNAPTIVKKCIRTLSTHNPKLPIIIITEANLNKYVTPPLFIMEKYRKGIISKTHFSDYIRVCLLQKYGGTWVDSTCYFTDKIPSDILNSSFFQFQNYSYYLLKENWSIETQNMIHKIWKGIDFAQLTGSNWFLHAKPNNPIISKTKLLLEIYWSYENRLINYFIFHHLLNFAVLNNKNCRTEFNKMPSYCNIWPFLLPEAFFKPFDKKLFDEFKKNSFVHKLNYQEHGIKRSKFYKCWIKNIF